MVEGLLSICEALDLIPSTVVGDFLEVCLSACLSARPVFSRTVNRHRPSREKQQPGLLKVKAETSGKNSKAMSLLIRTSDVELSTRNSFFEDRFLPGPW